jgi:hypothetical protein
MFAGSPTDAILRTRQPIGMKQTVRMIFFTGLKPTVFGILPKGSKFNQLYFVDSTKENVNFRRWIPQATFGSLEC